MGEPVSAYTSPTITEVGDFSLITRGNDNVGISDDGDGSGYNSFDQYPDDGRGA